MALKYTHELNEQVLSISGGYELDKEGRVPIDGREVLYVVGNAVVDGSCCGLGGCRYAVVPGFILKWKAQTDDRGKAVTLVEPIRDQRIKELIRKLILETETVQQVEFW
jgi:hypothetical protein